MTEKEKKKCTYCYGRGTKTETRTEQDFVMSVAMGSAVGSGYFPMTKTVTETVNCNYCHGTGKR